ncbi:MAG: hypothetical protein EOP51_16390 [Sphingobacteriales bacterium]|nr:MAG: hypothetical protein EOP51_16390 [Sphingobacteriales bacterium]
MKNILGSALIVVLFCSFGSASLKGVWEYCGGISNGTKTEKPTAYKLHRTYSGSSYEAFVIEPGEKNFKYEAGDYTLKADTCFETQTYSHLASQTIGVTVPYTYTIAHDTLKFKGILPNGTPIEEYWKKVK